MTTPGTHGRSVLNNLTWSPLSISSTAFTAPADFLHVIKVSVMYAARHAFTACFFLWTVTGVLCQTLRGHLNP